MKTLAQHVEENTLPTYFTLGNSNTHYQHVTTTTDEHNVLAPNTLVVVYNYMRKKYQVLCLTSPVTANKIVHPYRP